MELLTNESFKRLCSLCREHRTRCVIAFPTRISQNEFLHRLAHEGDELKEEYGIERYVRDFGIEFKNGSWIRTITPSTDTIRGRRCETSLYQEDCIGAVSDEVLRHLASCESKRPSHHWYTVPPEWCQEIPTYRTCDFGELESADISVLLGQ